ncbi:hypothetical protein ACFFWD_12110, partial [Bradyrhizobium erythrophlei]|uniref:hypothetical protein n=1 Tax=Bradyrhizobium erythrophlei TaxID=1437360 RepID=UPI0035EC618E
REPCGALAPLGEPRRMHGPSWAVVLRDARSPLLSMTVMELSSFLIVIARSKATKQSISRQAGVWIASLRSQ